MVDTACCSRPFSHTHVYYGVTPRATTRQETNASSTLACCFCFMDEKRPSSKANHFRLGAPTTKLRAHPRYCCACRSACVVSSFCTEFGSASSTGCLLLLLVPSSLASRSSLRSAKFSFYRYHTVRYSLSNSRCLLLTNPLPESANPVTCAENTPTSSARFPYPSLCRWFYRFHCGCDMKLQGCCRDGVLSICSFLYLIIVSCGVLDSQRPRNEVC